MASKYMKTEWGGFETLDSWAWPGKGPGIQGPGFVAKRLYIHPGCCMSNQRHWGRSENWNVVNGELGLSIGGLDRKYRAGECVTVPHGCWHCAYNVTSEIVEVIEIWHGKDLRESDIERKPYTGTVKALGWSYGANKLTGK
jgi:mannose-1-phosphate guanylyltransferase